MNDTAMERLGLEADLRRAIERGEFRLVYQPIVGLEGERICEVEALVRWQHPRCGLVSPSMFIPLAEETGLSAIMADAAAAADTLLRLKDLGIQLAIDDFGTGYSSLSYLKRFRVDTLKIDRPFVDKLGEDPHDTAIVRG